MNGAGGTSGGLGEFFIGLIMMIGGSYLFLNAITVTSTFGMGTQLYGVPAFGRSFSVTSGMILIPFMFGIGMIFFNAKNYIGWILAAGSIIALCFGVIASVRFGFHNMSAFDLIAILVLGVGGLGLFLRSLLRK